MPAPADRLPRPVPGLRASRSRVGSLLALVLLLAGLLAPDAHAQIVKEKPGRIRAANRRALREAKRTELPYKDSHLDVTPAHLRRGQSIQHSPEGSDKLQYKPNPHPADRLDQRHKKVKL